MVASNPFKHEAWYTYSIEKSITEECDYPLPLLQLSVRSREDEIGPSKSKLFLIRPLK